MLLTKSKTFIIGPVATLLGFIMNAIFMFLNGVFSIQNLGLCIILFTIIVYGFMTPLTIKQQKFSKLSARMNPEIQKIQAKYKGKQDQASMLKMNEETQAVYAKYGVSPTGSCLQLIIQMPILFALYQVIWNIPAYVDSVKEALLPLVDKILAVEGAQEMLTELATSNQVNFEKLGFTQNSIVDLLYKLKPAAWETVVESFPEFSDLILSTQKTMNGMNNFLGLNISDSPMNIIQSGLADGKYLLVIGAVLIPILSGLTQWISIKLSSTANEQQQSSNGNGGNMEASMKMMNNIMPIMSVVFCITLPAGLGIYWIASAVVRTVQQVIVNRHLDKIDVDAMIEKNLEKYNEKRKKQGLPPQKIAPQAPVTAKVESKPKKTVISEEERLQKMDEATDYYNSKAAKPGSIASKARMVEQYNEKTMKKK